VKDNVRVE